MYHWSLFTAGENVVTWHRVSTWVFPFIPPAGEANFLRSRNLITDEVELRVDARARSSGSSFECWWPAEVALIHRNFTGCQAGLTGLCHGSNAEESHPTEISVSLLRLLSVRADEFRRRAYLSIYLCGTSATYAGFISALLSCRSIRGRSGDFHVTFVVTHESRAKRDGERDGEMRWHSWKKERNTRSVDREDQWRIK